MKNNTHAIDPDTMKAQALLNAQNAVMMQEEKTKTFDDAVEGRKGLSQQSFDKDFSLANPTLSSGKELPQPTIFSGKLKTYQLKGMNWLGNLYEQGINGILADEMGLGKTVQSIAFFAYLAEVHDIWGPFLVVAPASTLHNWQQEVTRFVPNFKVLPYWGNPNDRKTLRKFWNQKETFLSTRENAPFNVLITSYQLVVQDVRYFQRIRWQYLVLDEAQAIKSSSSVRWKILLGFNCRNRLLLTGTPIQNTMAELWALLHFIMPTLFDSHEEFNEWFSKDIEAQAENKANLDENQLSRLHMILKPFMLRRVKKDVENELSDKIEIKLVCHLSTRQRLLYQAIKNKISIEDLVTSTTSSSATATNQTTNTLMNLVMQFRKVCNHPEIFERRDVRSPLNFRLPPYQLPKLIYHEGYISRSNPSRNRCLQNVFSVWTGEYIFRSLFGGEKDHSGCFSVTRFLNMSCSEVQRLFESLVFRLLAIALIHDEATKVRHSRLWHEGDNARLRRLSKSDLLLWPDLPTSCTCQENSPVLQGLIFTKQTSIFASHLSHKISRIPELVEMRQTQLREKRLSRKPHSKSSPSKSPHHSPLKSPFKSPTAESSFNWVNPYFLEPEHREMVTTSYPSFLMALEHKVTALPHGIYTSDRDAAYKSYEIQFGSHELRQVLSHGALHLLSPKERKAMLFPPPLMGLEATRPERHGWSRIQIPDRNALITDSGKLNVLNELLIKLKASGHRVLIYSQMTKMIAILEEFMSFKKYKYMRLDGSSKISDRRDMVQDFQTKSDIFVFLLSTRAGGLGINLTAADTVIFYDSDWNPTVDQQAMDRAHRLGQTKQVTVYRLVTKGTIEERILQRAKEKSEIQKIVISGGQFRPDALKPKEVVSLLLDDDEMESKFLQRQAERQATEVQTKKGGRKRKNPATDNNRESPKAAEKKRKWKTTAFSDDSNTGSEFFNIKTDQFDGDVSFEGDDISVGSTNDAMSLSLNEDSNLSFGTPQSSRLLLSLPVMPDPDSPTQDSPQNQKNGRNRVRLRGTGRGAAIRGKLGTGGKGRGSKSKGGTLAAAAAAAAAAAGAAAASAAAYAAYGFSFQATGKSASNSAGPASNTGD